MGLSLGSSFGFSFLSFDDFWESGLVLLPLEALSLLVLLRFEGDVLELALALLLLGMLVVIERRSFSC